MEEIDKRMNKVWVVTKKPWEGCPYRIGLIVATCNGQEEAIKEFRKAYGNETIEPDEAVEYPFVKGTLVEEPTA